MNTQHSRPVQARMPPLSRPNGLHVKDEARNGSKYPFSAILPSADCYAEQGGQGSRRARNVIGAFLQQCSFLLIPPRRRRSISCIMEVLPRGIETEEATVSVGVTTNALEAATFAAMAGGPKCLCFIPLLHSRFRPTRRNGNQQALPLPILPL